MREPAEQLADSLLYEGYALYPYTPGATKNATPTPFGIVYPPAYAEGNPGDLRPRSRMRVRPGGRRGRGAGGRPFSSSRRRASGTRRRRGASSSSRFALETPRWRGGQRVRLRRREEAIAGRVRMRAERLADGLARVKLCVHNPPSWRRGAAARPRAEALRSSLLSTHVVAEALRRAVRLPARARRAPSVPRWRLRERQHLAGARHRGGRRRARRGDLPARPPADRAREPGRTCSTTPRSRRRCCSTSTRSATRSAQEISDQDPAVREMVERAARTTPEEIMGLHGRLTPTPSPTARASQPRGAEHRGRRGRPFRKGGKVVLRPGERAATSTTRC